MVSVSVTVSALTLFESVVVVMNSAKILVELDESVVVVVKSVTVEATPDESVVVVVQVRVSLHTI